MAERPFVDLEVERDLSDLDLPGSLVEFFRKFEGVGEETDPERFHIRLCKLDESVEIGWEDLHVIGGDPPEGSWSDFRGFRIGISDSFDEIVYVLNCPCCKPGAILAVGIDIFGPGGTGPEVIEPTLVLAATFSEWLSELENSDWVEHCLITGSIHELPQSQRDHTLRRLSELNPNVDVTEL